MSLGLRPIVKWLTTSLAGRLYVSIAAAVACTVLFAGSMAVQDQSETLETLLLREGTSVARLLAHNARVGVFAENEILLSHAVGAAADMADVLGIAVFGDQGQVLLQRAGTGPAPGALPLPTPSSAPHVTEAEGSFTFWAPVFLREGYASEESLYLEQEPEGDGRPAGWVALTLSKRSLAEGRRRILGRAVAGSALLLTLAGLVTWLTVRRTTKPLSQLLRDIRSLGLPEEPNRPEAEFLQDSFGRLLASLRSSVGQVSELTATLESRVTERTQELATANAELQEARERLEERVRERTAELERIHGQLLHAEKLAAVGRLASSLAHEINNPIFGIRNVLRDVAASAPLGEDDAAMVDLAVAECDRLSDLIRDLQTFNRPTSGRLAPVDLRRVLDGVVLLARSELASRRVTLEKSYAHDLTPVWAVEDQLRQVFLNLLTNAMDALPLGGGTIRLTTQVEREHAVVRVQDTGSGIPAENLDRIFEPFFTTKPEVKGTGLGLPISYGIIRSHGGSIEVESRPDEGSTFTVRLPIEGGTK